MNSTQFDSAEAIFATWTRAIHFSLLESRKRKRPFSKSRKKRESIFESPGCEKKHSSLFLKQQRTRQFVPDVSSKRVKANLLVPNLVRRQTKERKPQRLFSWFLNQIRSDDGVEEKLGTKCLGVFRQHYSIWVGKFESNKQERNKFIIWDFCLGCFQRKETRQMFIWQGDKGINTAWRLAFLFFPGATKKIPSNARQALFESGAFYF